MFSGTQEKCATCGKTAYPLEKVGFKYFKQNTWSCSISIIELQNISVTNWAYGCSSVKDS